MKNIILSFALAGTLLLTGCIRTYQINPQMIANAVQPNKRLVYNPFQNKFSFEAQDTNDIVLTKQNQSGFSQYRSKNINLSTGTTYEFLLDGQWYGYNAQNLKFYQMVYRNNSFSPREMTVSQVEKLFPNLTVLPLSQARENILSATRYPLEVKSFLVLNDTDSNFYQYTFNPIEVPNQTPFKGLITVNHSHPVKLSRFGENTGVFPAYIIQFQM